MTIADKKRNGFTLMIHTTRKANDGGYLVENVRNDAVSLAKVMGWREHTGAGDPIEAKPFDPEAAKVLLAQKAAKEQADMERLQQRIDLVLENGGRPDLAALKTASEADFQLALAELIAANEEDEEPKTTKKAGRPAKA